MTKLINKIIFGLPIALFLGIGVLVSSDIIQPSYFKNLGIYWYFFVIALVVGYLALFLSSSYIENVTNKLKAYIMMLIFMSVESLFSLLAINTYYGSQEIPLIRQITALCLPLVFSLFYFLKIIETENTVKYKKNVEEIFNEFDMLESSKRDI